MITGLGLFLSVIYLIGVKEIPLSAQAKEIDDAYKEAKGAAVIFSMEEENASNRRIGPGALVTQDRAPGRYLAMGIFLRRHAQVPFTDIKEILFLLSTFV